MDEEIEQIRIRLSADADQAVKRIMELGGYTSVGHAIQRAITDELYLQMAILGGWKILMKRGDEMREIIISRGE